MSQDGLDGADSTLAVIAFVIRHGFHVGKIVNYHFLVIHVGVFSSERRSDVKPTHALGICGLGLRREAKGCQD